VLLGVLVAATVLLGLAWSPLMDFADRSARFFVG
jgi:hypothetical protein